MTQSAPDAAREPEPASAEPYEPIRDEGPPELVGEPESQEDRVLDARAKSVMPAVWAGLAAAAVALGLAATYFAISPPQRQPVFQAEQAAALEPTS